MKIVNFLNDEYPIVLYLSHSTKIPINQPPPPLYIRFFPFIYLLHFALAMLMTCILSLNFGAFSYILSCPAFFMFLEFSPSKLTLWAICSFEKQCGKSVVSAEMQPNSFPTGLCNGKIRATERLSWKTSSRVFNHTLTRSGNDLIVVFEQNGCCNLVFHCGSVERGFG